MAKHSGRRQPSQETRDEALRIARGTQRPGQTKEQTKLIAQGIQKGIDEYKKQQKAKARERDRQRKKPRQPAEAAEVREPEVQEKIGYRQHWLPWVLLLLSWLAMGAYLFLQ
jgi:hypothetical protein